MSWTRPNIETRPVAAGWVKPDGTPSAKPWPTPQAIGAITPPKTRFTVNGRNVVVQSIVDHPDPKCSFYAMLSPRSAHDATGWGATDFDAVAELEELDNARIAAGL